MGTLNAIIDNNQAGIRQKANQSSGDEKARLLRILGESETRTKVASQRPGEERDWYVKMATEGAPKFQNYSSMHLDPNMRQAGRENSYLNNQLAQSNYQTLQNQASQSGLANQGMAQAMKPGMGSGGWESLARTSGQAINQGMMNAGQKQMGQYGDIYGKTGQMGLANRASDAQSLMGIAGQKSKYDLESWMSLAKMRAAEKLQNSIGD
jgi:hypothetical protein